MTSLLKRTCRWSTGIGFALLLSGPVCADTYDVGLFEGGTGLANGTGSGQFSFTKTGPGTFGITFSILTTNASSAIASKCAPSPPCTYNFVFDQIGNMFVEVRSVNYDDGKVNAPAGHNIITGDYVEGLSGFADSASQPPDQFVTCGAGGGGGGIGFVPTCFYRIRFALNSACGPSCTANPGTWARTFTIERWSRSADGQTETFEATVVDNGRYFVRNKVNSVPEPGTILLSLAALSALAWAEMHRRRRVRV